MKVSELQNKGAVPEIILKITAKEEARDVRGGALKVCSATGEDDTGKVVITLWNQDIEKIKIGDTVKITKGWSQIFQDAMQVSSGKFGAIEVMEA